MSFKKVMLVGLVSACVMLLVVALPGVYGQPSTNAPSKLSVERSEISSTVIPVTWRNAANPDTIIRVFSTASSTGKWTGAATAISDTTREHIPIWGANTISIAVKYDEDGDSCAIRIHGQISNDGSNWARFPTQQDQSAYAVALDSSGSFDTDGSSITHLVNVSNVPTYARYLRLVAVKALSASGDTMNVRAWVNINRNDE